MTRKICLPEVDDSRGSLMFAQQGSHIPFQVKRIFAIYNVPSGSRRGGHAHYVQEQFLMMLAGECIIAVDDGESRVEEKLDRPSEAIYVPPGVWLELRDFSVGAICVVLSSGHYNEADYIRDYGDFLAQKSGRSADGTTRRLVHRDISTT
jgi:dTDP-4-dehydrorhamnose 3,5-epimerase-like enzyme